MKISYHILALTFSLLYTFCRFILVNIEMNTQTTKENVSNKKSVKNTIHILVAELGKTVIIYEFIFIR